MREYEVVYIFDSQLTDEDIAGKIEKFHGMVTGVEGAEISAVDHWGRRSMAYPINKRPNGYYAVAQFKAAAESLPEFERLLKLDDGLIRYLVVLHEGEPTAPMSIATREKSDDDGDDDDEED